MSEPFVKPSYSGFPEPSFIRRYRNILLQFKKTIQSSTDLDELQREMEHFLNINRQIVWPHHTSDVFHKDEAEKAVGKVVKEFQRYIKDIKQHKPTSYQDLLDALLIVESMMSHLKEGL